MVRICPRAPPPPSSLATRKESRRARTPRPRRRSGCRGAACRRRRTATPGGHRGRGRNALDRGDDTAHPEGRRVTCDTPDENAPDEPAHVLFVGVFPLLAAPAPDAKSA